MNNRTEHDEDRLRFFVDGEEVPSYHLTLQYRPQVDVAYFHCSAALADLSREERERVLLRLAHPEQDEDPSP